MRRFFASIFTALLLCFSADTVPQVMAQAGSPPKIESRSESADRLLQKAEAFAAQLKVLQADARIEGMSLDAVLKHKGLEVDIASFVDAHRTELELAATPASAGAWLNASRKLEEATRFGDSATAAWKAYDLAEQNSIRAAALDRLAAYARDDSKLQYAAALLEYALSLEDSKERKQALAAVKAQATMRVTDVTVDVESFSPSACLVLSAELAGGQTTRVEDYVRLPDGQDVSLRANGNRICLSGLRFGDSYKVTVLAGLNGKDGSRLYGNVDRTITVPDRKARINFGNGTYILPRVGDETVPLKTVNMATVELKLFRVSDRGLVPLLNSGVKSEGLYEWEENRLSNEYGTLVWEGAVDVESAPNKDVTTLVPVRDLIDGKGPGIYALVASDPNEDKKRRYRYEHQAQWLLVSDLGLMTLSGDDGLHVFVHSLETTKAARGVTLRLVARDNSILKELETGRDGHANFPAALLRGAGGASPAVLVAETDKGDYAFLSLDGPALDLSDRGTAGRITSGPLDAYVFTERGIYRPGETVHISAIVRDPRAVAVPTLPLTFKVFRPDGMEAIKTKLTGDAFGGYAYDMALTPGARTGLWRAAFFADDAEKSIGEIRFSVDDFVPERLSTTLETTSGEVTAEGVVDATVQADFLYGAPGADLSGTLDVWLERDPQPFADYKDFQFGLVQEEFRPTSPKRENFTTDANGAARISVAFAPLPDTSQPLRARLNAEVVDVGGRPVSDRAALPVRQKPVFLGIKTAEASFDVDAPAQVDLVALSGEGAPLAAHPVTVVWVREHHQYNWFRLDGRWQFRSTVVDEVVAEETLETGENGGLTLDRPLAAGRYRVDVFDGGGQAASSKRFNVGWWSATTSPDVPDALELSLEESTLKAGDRLRGLVKAPFEGRALVTVVNERLIAHKLITLTKDGSSFDFKVEADWGPGAYVLATALRPDAGEMSRLPVRATGLKWFSVARASHVEKLVIDAPDVALPGKTVDIPIRVADGAAGEKMKVILAAVDEGILNITRFKSPDPDAFFYGQRGFSMDLRDVYGRLIRAEEGIRGTLRTGGDAVIVTGSRMMSADARDDGSNLFAALSRTSRTVALIRRDVVLDESGTATVSLELPDFAGRLRLMAVAYGATMLGVGDGALTVRTPVVAELILPRFLAPGDTASAVLSLQNLSGEAKVVNAILGADGDAVELAGLDGAPITLAHKERRDIPVTVKGLVPGDAGLQLALSSDGMDDINRDWDISVRAAWPYVTRREREGLAPGETMEIAATDADDFYRITTSGSLTLSTRPSLEADRMMASLYAYAYRCTEQTVSRAMPALFHGPLSKLYDLPISKTQADGIVERAILTLLDRQKNDGRFGIWSLMHGNNDWLDAYATDFLLRAAEAGYEVSDATTALSLERMKRLVSLRGSGYAEAQAYALYLLARVGDISASEVRYFVDQFGGKLHTPLARAQVAAALHHVGERASAEQLFARAYKSARSKGYYGDYGSSTRDRAAFAALLAEVMPNSALMADLADILERDVATEGWLSTQEMAWIARASAAFAGDGASQLVASLNGKAVQAAQGQWSGLIGAQVPEGPLTIANDGDVPLRAIKLVRGVPKAAPEAVENGIRLTRSYFDMNGKPVSIGTVRRNERIVVLIEGVATADAVRETLVVDLLPAGLEIETVDTSDISFLPEMSGMEFEDGRDDRYVAAVSLGTRGGWRKNRFRVAYIVRAVTPGDYVLPGTFAEDMYQPQYHGQAAASRMTVVK